jgi:hypothetical protein
VLAEWKQATNNGQDKEAPPRPVWRQRNGEDLTIESLSGLLTDNPEGVTVSVDELSGWLGRMDAYSGGSAGKDRPAWLDAWSGRHDRPVNRATREPVVISHWAAGVIGAIQPEVLAQQLRKGGSTDGLIQRFMVYQMAPSRAPDLLAPPDVTAKIDARSVFVKLHALGEPRRFSLARPAAEALQEYMAASRVVAERTPYPRMREHLGKFPAFAARLALTLHCVQAAAKGQAVGNVVGSEAMNDAITLMRVLYRHSEAVYSVLDDASEGTRALMVSAAEAVLAKRWEVFKRGDLTRHATGWRSAQHAESVAALDLLIEMGWIKDITQTNPNRPGRRSDGTFAVNPGAFTKFAEHGERVIETRAQRFQSIQIVAAEMVKK